MDLDDEARIQGLQSYLHRIRTENTLQIPKDKIDQIIALLIMLNKADSVNWSFDKCEEFVAKLISDLVGGNLTQKQLEELMLMMAEVGNAPVISISEGEIRVGQYRRGILYLLATGVTLATLETIVPGALYFLLDSAYALYNAATTAGVTPETIIGEVITNPSPFSAGALAVVASRASYNLVIATVAACAAVARMCAQTVRQIPVADCLKYGAQLLVLAVAENVAERGVKVAERGVKAVSGVVTGNKDKVIAEWFEKDGLQHTQDAIIAAGQEAVNLTKSVVEESLDNMNEINRSEAQTGRLTDVNVDITRWLNHYIEELGGVGVSLTTLITELSDLNFNRLDSERIRIAETLDVRPNDPDFIALIAAYTLATNKTPNEIKTSSQDTGFGIYQPTESTVKRAVKRAISLPSDRFAFPEGEYPTTVRYESNQNTQNNSDFISNMDVDSEINIIDPINEFFKKDDDFKNVILKASGTGNLLGEIGKLSKSGQQKLIDDIKKTKTQFGVNHKGLENEVEILKVINEVLRENENENENDDNQDRSKKPKSGSSQNPKRGGRPRRSRRHKKRRSTLKRRRMKRRRTKKGKKRRHTKKRR